MSAQDGAAPGQAALLAVVDGHFFSDGPNPLQLVCMTEDDNDVECNTQVAEVEPGTTWERLEHAMAQHARALHYPAATTVQQRMDAEAIAAAAHPAPACPDLSAHVVTRTGTTNTPGVWFPEAQPDRHTDEAVTVVERREHLAPGVHELAMTVQQAWDGAFNVPPTDTALDYRMARLAVETVLAATPAGGAR